MKLEEWAYIPEKLLIHYKKSLNTPMTKLLGVQHCTPWMETFVMPGSIWKYKSTNCGSWFIPSYKDVGLLRTHVDVLTLIWVVAQNWNHPYPWLRIPGVLWDTNRYMLSDTSILDSHSGSRCSTCALSCIICSTAWLLQIWDGLTTATWNPIGNVVSYTFPDVCEWRHRPENEAQTEMGKELQVVPSFLDYVIRIAYPQDPRGEQIFKYYICAGKHHTNQIFTQSCQSFMESICYMKAWASRRGAGNLHSTGLSDRCWIVSTSCNRSLVFRFFPATKTWFGRKQRTILVHVICRPSPTSISKKGEEQLHRWSLLTTLRWRTWLNQYWS